MEMFTVYYDNRTDSMTTLHGQTTEIYIVKSKRAEALRLYSVSTLCDVKILIEHCQCLQLRQCVSLQCFECWI
jgi:hypothetical protein